MRTSLLLVVIIVVVIAAPAICVVASPAAANLLLDQWSPIENVDDPPVQKAGDGERLFYRASSNGQVYADDVRYRLRIDALNLNAAGEQTTYTADVYQHQDVAKHQISYQLLSFDPADS
ncbi:hypothetical protein ACP4OV_015361 [Aristida adscensionis]